jgi:signal transduction histidine kinase/DNA-binding response OmpR family regulator
MPMIIMPSLIEDSKCRGTVIKKLLLQIPVYDKISLANRLMPIALLHTHGLTCSKRFRSRRKTRFPWCCRYLLGWWSSVTEYSWGEAMEERDRLRVLVVDDEDPVCEMVRQILVSKGYVCEMAADAFEAMSTLCRSPFDLVVSDVKMEGKDGLALMREVRERTPHLPFIIMTGYPEEYSYGDIIDAGAADFITKPFSAGELKAKVSRVEKEKYANRRLREAHEALSWEMSANAAAAELSQALLATNSINEIAHLMLEHTKHLTGSKVGYVAYIDPQTGYLVSPTMTREIWEGCQMPDKDIVFRNFCGLWGWVLCNKEPLLTNNPKDDPRSSGIPAGHIPISRFISVPSLAGEELVGQLAFANSDREYTQKDVQLLRRFADIYAIALQRAHSANELEEYRDHLEVLVENRTAELLETNARLEQEIVERKRMGDSLKESEERVRSLNEHILNMLMIMSHDIRGPLVAIAANLKLLLRGLYGKLDQSVGNTVKDLLKRVSNVLGIADDCLGKAQAVEGSLQFSREVLDLRQDIIDVVLDELATDIERSGITIDNRLGAIPAGTIAINGSKIWFKTVFRNLFQNAIKYGGKGCTIAFGFEDCVTHYRLNVYNSGRPIPEQDRKRLFQKFGRIETGDNRPRNGVGLGLYLIRDIIRKHGGDIWYEARPDGSDFIFTLPR